VSAITRVALRVALTSCVVASAAVTAWTGPAHATASSTVINVDQRRVFIPLDQAVSQISTACRDTARVKVRVLTVTGTYTTRFDCGALGSDTTATVATQLVNVAQNYNDTAATLKLRAALYRELLPEFAIDTDQVAWGMAAGPGFRCEHVPSSHQIVKNMEAAARSTGETAEHWTLVEAVETAAACPEHLPALLRNVTRSHHADAAVAAKQRLAEAPSYSGTR
jgi:hypothetical protein